MLSNIPIHCIKNRTCEISIYFDIPTLIFVASRENGCISARILTSIRMLELILWSSKSSKSSKSKSTVALSVVLREYKLRALSARRTCIGHLVFTWACMFLRDTRLSRLTWRHRFFRIAHDTIFPIVITWSSQAATFLTASNIIFRKPATKKTSVLPARNNHVTSLSRNF